MRRREFISLLGGTQLNVEVGPKRLELMHELVPTATTIAVLINPTYPSAETESRNMQAAARTLGLQMRILRASHEREIDDAFATLVQLRAGTLVISSDPFFNTRPNSSPHWRSATRFPPSSNTASSRRPAA
jgi:putative ABC transport system substrate-binding protein